MSLTTSERNIRVARSSRASVEASRLDELPKMSKPERTPQPDRTSSKDHFGGTPKPTRETRVLPETSPAAKLQRWKLKVRRSTFSPAQRPLVFLFLFLLIFLPSASTATLTPAAPQTLTETLTETRITRTVFEYVMQISVTNSDTKTARGVLSTVTSTSPRTTIVEGSVSFGSIAPGLAAAGADTFTLRHDRTVPFDPAVLQWVFVKVPADPTVAAPSSPTMLTSATVTGTTDPGAGIEIVGGAQTITGTSHATTGVFNLSVPLQTNRLNPLFVTAFNPAGRSAPVPAAVLQDAQPPTLFIDFPKNGDQLTNDTIVVGRRVGDMLSGYQGLTVSVNGQPATVNVGIGNNGTFERSAVPLVLGSNTITATATDINGNAITLPPITVHRIPITGPRMIALSGDMQKAPCTPASRNPSSSK